MFRAPRLDLDDAEVVRWILGLMRSDPGSWRRAEAAAELWTRAEDVATALELGPVSLALGDWAWARRATDRVRAEFMPAHAFWIGRMGPTEDDSQALARCIVESARRWAIRAPEAGMRLVSGAQGAILRWVAHGAEIGPSVRAAALVALADEHYAAGHIDLASDVLEEASGVDDMSDPEVTMSRLEVAADLCEARPDRSVRAEDLLDRALHLERAAAIGRIMPGRRAQALIGKAAVHFPRQVHLAIPLLEDALDDLGDDGHRALRLQALHHLAMARLYSGHPEAALERLEQAWPLYDAETMPQLLAERDVVHAEIKARLGQDGGGLRKIREALDRLGDQLRRDGVPANLHRENHMRTLDRMLNTYLDLGGSREDLLELCAEFAEFADDLMQRVRKTDHW